MGKPKFDLGMAIRHMPQTGGGMPSPVNPTKPATDKRQPKFDAIQRRLGK
jgi:hypothetical protein